MVRGVLALAGLAKMTIRRKPFEVLLDKPPVHGFSIGARTRIRDSVGELS